MWPSEPQLVVGYVRLLGQLGNPCWEILIGDSEPTAAHTCGTRQFLYSEDFPGCPYHPRYRGERPDIFRSSNCQVHVSRLRKHPNKTTM
ncbi:uncharacterized protein CANTADRAFT_90835 [Suhomyces tanzawaensis NRRL Y-17324]|uniref:Uncharacterized protein n=1 Tax=Suhomyces tanzawaensis NRRL Y-17324 TaxID=984487 RepID=A0A1E4SGA1_9ASCO|nr:uncharacterized protein CANTADRAFT_90835 [Suhomyces tanzawaensis NRRL Y-17324]ODV78506.1 hypothetical protein CANTADRAFT_90835 [Suhomyces tanzawaensis NRRL Y-17324]